MDFAEPMLHSKSSTGAACFARWFSSNLTCRRFFLLVACVSLVHFLSVSSPKAHRFSSLAPLNSVLQQHPSSSRMAVCLVGGARRFEITGPSIIDRVLKEYPNADLFLHTPMDHNAFKLGLLKAAPRLASVRIFNQQPIPETQSQVRVLTAANSPNGIQGMLQYFNLVEGCLTMIKSHQERHNFTYDWIVRTRVDTYWSAPLSPDHFIPDRYVIPSGSSYGGLNDRFGIGDLNSSTAAMSRLSLIPNLDRAKFNNLNSEGAFKAQLHTKHMPYVLKQVPFCIVSERKYQYPPAEYGVPVAALSSLGPLSGAKCRPCKPACRGSCVKKVMKSMARGWGWTNWANGTLELCDAHGEWKTGWETIFDRGAGKELATARRHVKGLSLNECIDDFNEMKNQAAEWEAPPPDEICKLGLGPK